MVKSEPELVSVVIVNYNGRRSLGKVFERCLDSVLRTDYPRFEVLFVDNASTDGSAELVETRYGEDKRLRVIRNERNLGYAEGNNRGIRQAKGAFIALLNSDTEVDIGWLSELVETAKQAGVGAVQSKLLRLDNPSVLDSAGGWVDYYGYHLERGRGQEASSYSRTSEIFYAKGAGVLLNRDVLQKTGLFDSDFFMYFEEVDLCWRIWLAGYRVLFAPASLVRHASGSTASRLQERTRLYFSIRNHLLVLLKNYGFSNKVKSEVVSVLFELRNMAVFAARRKPLVVLAIGQALLWNLSHLKDTWMKRRVVQERVRRVSDEEIQRHMVKPYPPFPLYLVFSRSRYQRRQN
ncbi:MAG: glycosyltransferase family 2 protein [Candidatus Bathyarchaeia archaeon]